jgi:cellulose synthase/poly-beta-1,6-N-acetylglucosamine synthase-like glycosyltransferase
MMQSIEQEDFLDVSSPIEISDQVEVFDQGMHEQVARYSTWLSGQAKRDPAASIHASQEYTERAAKIVQVGEQRIQTFAPFRYKYSALQTITPKQSITLIMLGLVVVLGGIWNWRQTFVALVALIAIGYMLHLILDFALALSAVRQPVEEHIDDAVIHALRDAEWPVYTILCPLYREARVVPQFVKAMQALDYPAEKLQILFLTEADDAETRAAIHALRLPSHFQIITVPDGSPRTKPRACNYGLMKAQGQYVVIYDAEDVPDPLQLKKAVLTFANHGPNLACVQAKLNFYNPEQNLLTRWFTAEYSLWFDLILPGLQQLKLAIPLGGTSNHFPTQTLRALGGWDGFNVTEDCDLGLRLAWFRLETVVLNSTTYEEANSNFKNWIRQRSRWIKGYMQTYLVHMREPLHYLRYGRLREFLSLQLMVGGKAGVLLINPLMWFLLLASILFRSTMNSAYGNLVPLPIFYISAICLIAGNFFYGYIYLLGCMRRKQYRLVKWMLLIPFYWLMASIAAGMAFYQLITKPHYWEKTQHGLHLEQIAVSPDLAVEEIKKEANELEFVFLPTSLQGAVVPLLAQKYARLDAVPVVSVQDTIEEMIKPQKPAFSSAERASLRQSQHVKEYDPWQIANFVVACIASIIACRYYLHQILAFKDVLTHLQIARSIVAGAIPFDLTKLGGSWLPLPHLLMLPFIWNDDLWRSGLAGSIPSMLCYVVAARYVFLIARRLTHDSRASFIGALLFILNINVLYLQTTPASAMVSIATSLMACYYFLAWVQENQLKQLLLAAGCTLLATLAGYEGWILFLVLVVLVVGTGLLKRQPGALIQGSVLVFSLLAGLGISVWLLWCAELFGSPFYFLSSHYSPLAPQSTYTFVTYHDFWQSFYYYALSCAQIVGPILAGLAVFALAVFVARKRFKPDVFAMLALLVPCIFALLSLYCGLIEPSVTTSLPLGVSQALRTVPIGVEVAPAAAVFVATLIGRWQGRWQINSYVWTTALQLLCLALIVAQSILLVMGIS